MKERIAERLYAYKWGTPAESLKQNMAHCKGLTAEANQEAASILSIIKEEVEKVEEVCWPSEYHTEELKGWYEACAAILKRLEGEK